MPIQSKQDYQFYLDADEIALKIPNDTKGRLRARIFNQIWKYERILRRAEYFANCHKGTIWLPLVFMTQYRLSRYGFKLGFEIPVNAFGAGLSIAHHGMITVNGNVKVGENCRLHNGVTIGTEAGYSDRCPTIGDSVFIAPGVQIFGSITIANGIAIGANSVVNKSFPEEGITIAGAPARKISDKGSKMIFIRSTEILRNKRAKQKQ
jgi:serine O-acetyltransferase